MDIIENLVSAADPGCLAMYVTLMAVFLGSVALAHLPDDAWTFTKRAAPTTVSNRTGWLTHTTAGSQCWSSPAVGSSVFA